ncbi:MAG: YCF48-related protein, partial [Cyanobacteria bacterium P01_F01_bin.13]
AVISMDVSPTFAADQTLAIATYVGELYISNDAGSTWQSINQSLHLPLFTNNFKPLNVAKSEQDPRRFFDIALSSNYAEDTTLFSSILYTKILRSTNGGQKWSVHPLSQEVRGVSLAVSPNFKADNTVFSTNQKGIVFRSQDGGKRYERVGQLDKQPGNDSPSLVISPNFANDKTLFNTGTRGVYKSEDAGKSWSLLTENTDLEELPAAQIAVSPNYATDQTLFVASGKGLYRTQDDGKAWERLDSESYGTNPFVEAIAISPNYANDQTVITSVRGRGFFKSQNGGDSFRAVGTPDLAISRYTHVPSAGRPLQFSSNYAEDNTLFGFGAADAAVYRSTDGGETWETLAIPRLKIDQIAAPSTLANVGMFININKRRLIGIGVLGSLMAAGFVLFKRILFKRMTPYQRWLSIGISGFAFAVGWAAFDGLLSAKMLILLVAAAVGTGLVWILSKGGLITFPKQAVHSLPKTINYSVPTWLKVTVIALVVLRLIFSLSHLADKPYNADEVRGFYRLSGYYEEEIKREAFRGQILTAQDLKDYQIPSDNKTFGDTLTSLATSPEHTPGYYAVSWRWVKLWKSPLSARVLAVLLGVVYLPCLYWLCLELFRSAFTGWVAMALLSLSPYHMLLAQGARQYSLFTIAVLASSLLLLRALRLGKIHNWLAYSAALALGLYSHLFFFFLLIAHGLYVLAFERRRLIAFGVSAGAGLLAFGPWLWVVVSSLDTINENTQSAQGRNSSLIDIVRFTRDKLGDIFLNLNNTSAIERLTNPLFLVLIALACYCLIRWSPGRVWSFVLLPIVTNYIFLAPPDLLLGGERSLRSRYLIIALLSITLTVAFFLANAMRRSKYGWERLAWTGVFLALLGCGFASGVTIARTPGLDFLEHGRTASVVNQEMAPLINASENPLVLSAATHSFALALSHEVHDNVSFQLVQDVEPNEWERVIDLPDVVETYSDVFVYFPNPEFIAFLETAYQGTLDPVFEKTLYRVTALPQN